MSRAYVLFTLDSGTSTSRVCDRFLQWGKRRPLTELPRPSESGEFRVYHSVDPQMACRTGSPLETLCSLHDGVIWFCSRFHFHGATPESEPGKKSPEGPANRNGESGLYWDSQSRLLGWLLDSSSCTLPSERRLFRGKVVLGWSLSLRCKDILRGTAIRLQQQSQCQPQG